MRVARSLGACVLGLAVVGALLALVFRGPGDHRALAISAGIALAVQALVILVLRVADQRQLLTVWVGSAGLRLVVLVVYALALVRPLGLPAPAALIGLAAFLFVTTLVESRLLTR